MKLAWRNKNKPSKKAKFKRNGATKNVVTNDPMFFWYLNSLLLKNQMVNTVRKKYDKIREGRGMKWWDIDGKSVLALNHTNAVRKAAAQKN